MEKTSRTEQIPMTPWMYAGGSQGGPMLRGLLGVLVVCMITAALLGLSLARADLLNPITNRAMADQLAVETEAQRGQLEYENEVRKIELDERRELQRIGTESAARKARLTEQGVELLFIALAIGLFALLFAGAIYLVCRAAAQFPKRPTGMRYNPSRNGRILEFPNKRSRTKYTKREPIKDDDDAKH